MSELFGVVGSGTMGAGIAQVAARAGHDVVMRDVAQEFLARGMAAIDKSLQRDVDKDRLSPDEKGAILARIKTTTGLDAFGNAFIVIEAATEDLEIKTDIFRSLDEATKPDAILASNTSSISITKLGAVTRRADKVIGMHFMNPVPVMKLVEVIRGAATSDATYESIRALAEKLGKMPLECQDSPGFISNRVLLPMINEAIFALSEGVASRESDVCLAIMNVLYDGFNDSKYRPCPLLKRYVDAGWLGKKTGRGFYEY